MPRREYNYLGVIIDSGLSFGQYMDNILNRVNQKLFIMSKVRPSITLETALLLYKQTIVPIIEYIGIVMDSSTHEYATKLDRMQLKAIKCIRNDFTISSEEAENYGNQLGLQLLEDRRKEQLLILMFKYSKLGKHVDHHRPEVVLRNNDAIKFLKRKTEKEKVMKSPYYRGCALWDQLTFNIQLSANIYIFKKTFKAN